MRRGVRILGTLMVVGGVLTLGWAVLVWQWQDPFTALYTHVEQQRLAKRLDTEFKAYGGRTLALAANQPNSVAVARRTLAAEAAADRKRLREGDPLGRLTVGRIGLKMVVVQGTDESSLEKGPGHYAGSYLPGQNRLIYIAGHRTTYLAPFSHIDAIRVGDWITLQMPYATFKYVVTSHRVVPATDLAVLRSPNHEVLILQACHPRFFATHRYLVYAKPVEVELPDGQSFALASPRVKVSSTS
jgi:sortase A